LNRQHKSCVFDQDFENKLFYFVLNRFYFKNKSGVGVPKFGRKVGVGVLKVKKWEFLKHWEKGSSKVKLVQRLGALASSVDEAGQLKRDLESIYELDYEDVISGGLKTRFKYRQVKPDTHGLSLQDLFEKDDKELNRVVSLKKLAPYGDDTDSRWHSRHESSFSNRTSYRASSSAKQDVKKQLCSQESRSHQTSECFTDTNYSSVNNSVERCQTF